MQTKKFEFIFRLPDLAHIKINESVPNIPRVKDYVELRLEVLGVKILKENGFHEGTLPNKIKNKEFTVQEHKPKTVIATGKHLQNTASSKEIAAMQQKMMNEV